MTAAPRPDLVTSSDPFPHGVASFDPAVDGVLLWTRVEAGAEVGWVVARDPAGRAVVAAGTATADAAHDGCLTVDVPGLEPGTTYHYWFERGGRRSTVARTRTLPEHADRVRIALTCCADYSEGRLAVYRAIAEADVDLVLHLGDYIYEDEGDGDVHQLEPPRELVDLDDYRTRYAQIRHDPDLQALHHRHPVVAVWDDHDVADNAWRHGAKAHDPDRHGPWDDRLRSAARARQEWLPARLPDPDDLIRLWRSVELGDLAEVVVLDTRIWGRDPQVDEGDVGELDDPDRSLLGDDQRAWMRQRILDRSRPWCLVASQVTVNPIALPVPGDVDLPARVPSGYGIFDGRAICTDEWDGYPAERDRLTDVLAERGGGAVLLSGDVHSFWAFEGPLDDEGRPVAVELTCSSATSGPMGRYLPGPIGDLAERVLAARQDDGIVRWCELDECGYVLLDVTPARLRAHVFAVEPADPHARSRPLTSWEVHPDRPGRLVPTTDDPRSAGPTPAVSPPPATEGPGSTAEPVGEPTRSPIGAAVAAVGALLAAAAAVATAVLRRRRSH